MFPRRLRGDMAFLVVIAGVGTLAVVGVGLETWWLWSQGREKSPRVSIEIQMVGSKGIEFLFLTVMC